MESMRFALGTSNPSAPCETVVEIIVTWDDIGDLDKVKKLGLQETVQDCAAPRRPLGEIHQVCRR
jgi:hypothetical protein